MDERPPRRAWWFSVSFTLVVSLLFGAAVVICALIVFWAGLSDLSP
jgi:hypothetical protein